MDILFEGEENFDLFGPIETLLEEESETVVEQPKRRRSIPPPPERKIVLNPSEFKEILNSDLANGDSDDDIEIIDSVEALSHHKRDGKINREWSSPKTGLLAQAGLSHRLASKLRIIAARNASDELSDFTVCKLGFTWFNNY